MSTMRKLPLIKAEPTVAMPQYSEAKGWTGGDPKRLYHITDTRTGQWHVKPVEDMRGVGPDVGMRHATREEAEKQWQKPLHAGWKVADVAQKAEPIAKRDPSQPAATPKAPKVGALPQLPKPPKPPKPKMVGTTVAMSTSVGGVGMGKGELRKNRFEDVVFQQEGDADEAMGIMNEHGHEAAVRHLMQWHQPGNHDMRDKSSAGSQDRVFRSTENPGYVMSYNPGLPYVGLEFDTQHQGMGKKEPDPAAPGDTVKKVFGKAAEAYAPKASTSPPKSPEKKAKMAADWAKLGKAEAHTRESLLADIEAQRRRTGERRSSIQVPITHPDRPEMTTGTIVPDGNNAWVTATDRGGKSHGRKFSWDAITQALNDPTRATRLPVDMVEKPTIAPSLGKSESDHVKEYALPLDLGGLQRWHASCIAKDDTNKGLAIKGRQPDKVYSREASRGVPARCAGCRGELELDPGGKSPEAPVYGEDHQEQKVEKAEKMTQSNGRKYRQGPDGMEKPVWASKSKTAQMGREWADHHWHGTGSSEPVRYGNRVHDEAAAERWKELSGSHPQWHQPTQKSELYLAGARLHYHHLAQAQRLGKSEAAKKHADLCASYMSAAGLDPALGVPDAVRDPKDTDLSKSGYALDREMLGLPVRMLPLIKGDYPAMKYRRYKCATCGLEQNQQTNGTHSFSARCPGCSWKGERYIHPEGTPPPTQLDYQGGGRTMRQMNHIGDEAVWKSEVSPSKSKSDPCPHCGEDRADKSQATRGGHVSLPGPGGKMLCGTKASPPAGASKEKSMKKALSAGPSTAVPGTLNQGGALGKAQPLAGILPHHLEQAKANAKQFKRPYHINSTIGNGTRVEAQPITEKWAGATTLATVHPDGRIEDHTALSGRGRSARLGKDEMPPTMEMAEPAAPGEPLLKLRAAMRGMCKAEKDDDKNQHVLKPNHKCQACGEPRKPGHKCKSCGFTPRGGPGAVKDKGKAETSGKLSKAGSSYWDSGLGDAHLAGSKAGQASAQAIGVKKQYSGRHGTSQGTFSPEHWNESNHLVAADLHEKAAKAHEQAGSDPSYHQMRGTEHRIKAKMAGHIASGNHQGAAEAAQEFIGLPHGNPDEKKRIAAYATKLTSRKPVQ